MANPNCDHNHNDDCEQVVEYQYKPEYLARFTAGEREKMQKRQTGVIAQVANHHHYHLANTPLVY